MVKKFTITLFLVSFALTAQADAQLFRRWSVPQNYQAQQRLNGQQFQQQSQCQQQQEYQRQQMLRQQQERVALNPLRSRQAQISPEQIQLAQLELLRQRQRLAQLQAALASQQQANQGGFRNFRFDYRAAIQNQLERQKQAVQKAEDARQRLTQTRSAPKQPVAPGSREAVSQAKSAQQDIARQSTIQMPTLTGPTPVRSADSAAVAPQAVTQQPQPVKLIEPAETAPVGILKKDPAVVKANAVEPDKPSKSISVLKAPAGKSVLKTTEEPGSLGGVKLDGPAGDK